MTKHKQVKYLIDKAAELVKFCAVIGLLCFMLVKAPAETAQVIAVAAAFILGGKIPKNLQL